MKPAGQMTLTLTSELEQFVREEVRRGAFASSSEYVRDLIRERYLKERDRAEKLKALETALERGIADAEAGRTMPLDEAFRSLKAIIDGHSPELGSYVVVDHNWLPTDTICVLRKNAKQINSMSNRRYGCYRNGMTVAEYEAAVANHLGQAEAKKCRRDLAWDISHSFIRVCRKIEE